MDKCDFWALVDFGRGPVEVRCTQTGPHANHRTDVILRDLGSEVTHARRNIFEQRETD